VLVTKRGKPLARVMPLGEVIGEEKPESMKCGNKWRTKVGKVLSPRTPGDPARYPCCNLARALA
jgi:antitoxin (DNA-binding transcriptional repressor) of toxin-antitoxin stability system